MGELILLRHGESIYNQSNLFTGWTDIDLSPKGIDDAKKAGERLKKENLYPDICFTSWLKRAIHTAQLALREMNWEHIDIIKSWKINERHYGKWQEKNKDDIKKEVGEEMFLKVRRGYDTPPPPLDDDDIRAVKRELKYRDIPSSILPKSESLSDTRKRTVNYYYKTIVPHIAEGKTVLITAHGNSLRALMMEIENLSKDEIIKVEIAPGELVKYSFDETMKMIKKSKH